MRGLGDQLEEGVITLELLQDGSLIRQRQLDVAQALRDARHVDFPDLDGDRRPDDLVLTLDPVTLDSASTYEGRLRHADGDELLAAGLARIGASGSAKALEVAWPEVASMDRCDRPVTEPDCTWSDWSADLSARPFGTPVSVTATGDDGGARTVVVRVADDGGREDTFAFPVTAIGN